jgi:predicted ATP-grasp superfamily ATP-dependent carboligase
LAIKPAIKENFFYDTKAKAWRADTLDQLHRLYARARRYIKAEEILLQEIIPGDGSTQYSFCAFFKDGRPHSSLVARRQRQHPLEFGRAATYVETTDEPLVAELSNRLLAAIDYYGLVEVEFKRDPRDGIFKLLDVNTRVWGFHSLGAAAGVDFSYLLFADQLNRPISPCLGKAGIGWVRLLSDIPIGLASVLRGSQSAASWLGTVSRAHVESVFTKDDPLPFLAEALMFPYLLRTKYL